MDRGSLGQRPGDDPFDVRRAAGAERRRREQQPALRPGIAGGLETEGALEVRHGVAMAPLVDQEPRGAFVPPGRRFRRGGLGQPRGLDRHPLVLLLIQRPAGRGQGFTRSSGLAQVDEAFAGWE